MVRVKVDLRRGLAAGLAVRLLVEVDDLLCRHGARVKERWAAESNLLGVNKYMGGITDTLRCIRNSVPHKIFLDHSPHTGSKGYIPRRKFPKKLISSVWMWLQTFCVDVGTQTNILTFLVKYKYVSWHLRNRT
jgi:hypothetical protein